MNPMVASEVPCAWCWVSDSPAVNIGTITAPPPPPKNPPAMPVTAPTASALKCSRRVTLAIRHESLTDIQPNPMPGVVHVTLEVPHGLGALRLRVGGAVPGAR